MAEIFEMIMVLSFGLSWPISIAKTLKAKTAKGKSPVFIGLIVFGYICGITSKILAKYLQDVVTNGSGKNAYIEGYTVGGKTGTAQKYENGVIAQGKYVMSFVGFFPANNPKYIALVIVDEPVGGQYGSTVAAPLCKDIFNWIINAKNL